MDGERTWIDKDEQTKASFHGNRQRVKRSKGKNLQKRRSEPVERSFAHVCETGGARKSWLRGLENVRKRHLISVAAHNLGLVMRSLIGFSKPRAFSAGVGLAVLCHRALFVLAATPQRLSDYRFFLYRNTASADFARAKMMKDSIKSRASHLISSFYCSFAVFPKERVCIGQSWEVVDTIDRGRGRIRYKYTWQGNRFVDGIQCCEIAVEAVAMAGRSDQGVAEKLDQGEGVILFDRVAGQVVQCKFNSKISITNGSGGTFSTQSTETLDFRLSRGEMIAPK
jgi:hypothetical protein